MLLLEILGDLLFFVPLDLLTRRAARDGSISRLLREASVWDAGLIEALLVEYDPMDIGLSPEYADLYGTLALRAFESIPPEHWNSAGAAARELQLLVRGLSDDVVMDSRRARVRAMTARIARWRRQREREVAATNGGH